MKHATINLYSLNELSEKAKETTIAKHADFLESIGSDYEEENGEIKTDYTRPTDEETAENIKANEYLYFANGEIANVCHYTGKHPKAGTTELNFYGEIFII
jgi:hypothetical protein